MNRIRTTILATLPLVAAAMLPQAALAQVSNVLGQNAFGVAPTVYQQADTYLCGPAVAQMILSTATVAPVTNPIPGQQTLFNQIVGGQGGNYTGGLPLPNGKYYTNNGNYATNPQGLQTTLTTNASGYSWVAYNIAPGNANAGLNSANRTLAYDITNYKVAGAAMVAAAIADDGPVIGGFHWLTIYGADTNVQPTASGNFKVNGFYTIDPDDKVSIMMGTTGGNGLWPKYFLPVNTEAAGFKSGSWKGNYAFVADPDSPDTIDPVFPNAPGNLGSELTGAQADSYAANDIAAFAGLANDAAFEGGGFTMSGEMEDLADAQLAQDEWLVPYDNGSGDLTGVALIDADTGVLDGAFWNEGGDLPTGFMSQLAGEEEATSLFPPDNMVVPEPGSLVLLASGGLGIGLAALRRSRRANAAA